LAGLFVDYVDHLEHHLRKMLGRWESGRHEMGGTPGCRPDRRRAGGFANARRWPSTRLKSPGPGQAVEWAPHQWSTADSQLRFRAFPIMATYITPKVTPFEKWYTQPIRCAASE